MRASDKQSSYLDTFTLTSRGESTDVTFQLEMHMNGVNAFVVPIVFPLVGAKDIRARMALLKDKVEGRPSAIERIPRLDAGFGAGQDAPMAEDRCATPARGLIRSLANGLERGTSSLISR